MYSVYILVKNKKPIYVGCTSDIKRRLYNHKLTKDFDEYIILKKYKDKKEAYSAENSVFRFISVFGSEEWLNSKDLNLSTKGYLRGFNTKAYV